jgi:hypothetical protein
MAVGARSENENSFSKIIALGASKDVTLALKRATNNLFLIVKTHVNNRLNATTGTLSQLDKIGQFIVDLTQITVR